MLVRRSAKRMLRTLKFLSTFIPKRGIAEPRLGIFDLTGGTSDHLIEIDKVALAPIFPMVEESKAKLPACDVLFLYATLDPGGSLSGTENYFRATIRDVAIKVLPDHLRDAPIGSRASSARRGAPATTQCRAARAALPRHNREELLAACDCIVGCTKEEP